MTDLKVFKSTEFGELGVMTVNGKEYFPATQCAKLLGHKNPQEAIRLKCKGVRKILHPSRRLARGQLHTRGRPLPTDSEQQASCGGKV